MGTADDQRVRVVLAADTTAEAVEEVALDVDWLLVDGWAASDERPYEDLYVDRDEQTSISYIDDHLIGLRYLVLRGPRAEDEAEVARQTLPVVSGADAIAALRSAQSSVERVVAIPAVALAAGPPERAGAVAALVQAAGADDPALARAVILASTYVGWSELTALLTRLQVESPHAEVRRDARLALEGLAAEEAAANPGD